MIRDAILMSARKPTRVSLIYHMESTTKKYKRKKLKSTLQICSEVTVNIPTLTQPSPNRDPINSKMTKTCFYSTDGINISTT